MKSRNRITVQPTQRLALSATLAASIRLLHADAAGLSRYLEEQAAENPGLVLTRAPATDWTPRWRAALGQGGAAPDTRPDTRPDTHAAAAPSLMARVQAQIEALALPRDEARIALALAEALEPSGWLGQPPDAVARRLGLPPAAVDRVLTRLQDSADPAGLFARGLADCLRLQAVEAGEFDPPMAAVLARLPLVAAGAVDRLAREAGLDPDTVRQRIGLIRGYDPKPGAQFEPLAAPLREPDLVAEAGPRGWTVALNRSALPSVALAPGAVGQNRAAARALIRMVEGRNATLLAVGQAVLQRQAAALDQGPGALVPMTMGEIAEALGLHESTVSRVVAGTAVDTPRGTWWLRSLFTRAARDGGPAAGALRDRLSRLVAAEDPAAPLSDAALAQALAESGAPIARRTVAKYREMLNLPPAHRRRSRK
jgi:RNA polymerase sigma-54 factor